MKNPDIISDSDRSKVYDLYERGINIYQIEKMTGVTGYKIRKILLEKGINVAKRTPYVKIKETGIDRIVEKYEEGYSILFLSDKFNYSEEFIKEKLKEKGVSIREELETGKLPIDCDTEGARCVYKLKIAGGYMCDYLCMVGHSRGCDPKQCTKYIIQTGKRGRKSGKTKK